MKNIPLTRGKVAIVDDEWAHLASWKWTATFFGYVRRSERLNERRMNVFMHHAVMGRSTKGLMVDHINGDKLDNRKSNLRFVTRRQNGQNRTDRKSGKMKSRFVGVYPTKSGNWFASIRLNGKNCNLGTFKEEKYADIAYQSASKTADTMQLKERP